MTVKIIFANCLGKESKKRNATAKVILFKKKLSNLHCDKLSIHRSSHLLAIRFCV